MRVSGVGSVPSEHSGRAWRSLVETRYVRRYHYPRTGATLRHLPSGHTLHVRSGQHS